MAHMLWLVVATAVLTLAAVLGVRRSSRQRGVCLACAMVGTFPGVWLYQLGATPVVAALLVAVHYFWKAAEPGDARVAEAPMVIAVSLTGVALASLVFLAASVAGFADGWR